MLVYEPFYSSICQIEAFYVWTKSSLSFLPLLTLSFKTLSWAQLLSLSEELSVSWIILQESSKIFSSYFVATFFAMTVLSILNDCKKQTMSTSQCSLSLPFSKSLSCLFFLYLRPQFIIKLRILPLKLLTLVRSKCVSFVRY